MSTDTVDEFFELAADATDTEATENSEDNTNSTEESTATYPNVLRTYTVGTDHDDINTNPEGTLTVAEFASHLTVQAILAGAGVDGVVKDPAVYTAVKAKRHPLPVVLVYPEGVEATEDNQNQAKVYLPQAEAEEAWKNRPTRGDGNGSSVSKRSFDDLLEDAAKKLLATAAIKKRLDRTQSQFDKASGTLTKYEGWLRTYFKDETDPAEAVKTAIANKAAEIEESEAAKAESEKSDIA